jgi:hypothetical protein
MALYAFDGTWNEAKTTEDPGYQNSNVVRFFNSYAKNTPPGSNFYVAGVGTRYDVIGRVLGGAFGLGELPRIKEAYAHLCRAWAAGDTAVDIVGFSRGAATTLDFCHYLQERGIRHPDTDDLIEGNPQIRFLGVWDTVAAFGLANLGNEVLNIGHHLSLPRKNLKYCFHALALDERRLSFLPTRLPGACEVWFRGAHSDIGGGNGNRGLNDITLRWMFRKAQASGLPITDADIAALQPEPTEPKPAKRLRVCVRAISSTDRRHHTVTSLEDWTNPPDTCPIEAEVDEHKASEVGVSGIELLPVHVRRRIAAMWEAADKVAHDKGFNLDHARAWLLNLLEGRVILVTNEAELARACANVGVLIATAAANAKRRDFHVLSEFFLNEALFSLPHLYPVRD